MNSLGIDKPPARCRIVVAMSGGVDSATVAALLVAEGYDVVGVTLQLYDHGRAVSRPRACCAGQDIHDARRVADALSIPHYVLDYERRFRDDVMDPFADSYTRGETPIPCVLCNQTVKFRDLLATAQDLEADALATGHYVRRIADRDGVELHRAADRDRDQSYFLFTTTREQLRFLRFPLGGMTKPETRALARRLGLRISEKPDSQDICFVPGGDYARVVARLRPDAEASGDIVDRNGTVLGRHRGIIHYTVGQRRGLGLGGGPALYVLRIEPDTRRVIVGPREALARRRVSLRGMNWLGHDAVPSDGYALEVKHRSTMTPVQAVLYPGPEGRAEIMLDQAEPGVAPGQACVFYDRDRVLGGGWIEREEVTLAA